MNTTELRAHLDGVTSDVTPSHPAVGALRRRARQRRLRERLAALVVLLLAGLGTGLGFVLSGGGGGLVTATTPSVVQIPCAATRVVLVVGQTLAVAPCPSPGAEIGGLVSTVAGVLDDDGGQRYTALRTGEDRLQIGTVGCAQGATCPAVAGLDGVITVLVVDRVASGPGSTVDVGCGGSAAQLVVGQQLRLVGCPADTSTVTSDPAVLAGAGTSYRAAAPGAASVAVVEPPVCPSGSPCPAVAYQPTDVEVTVVPAVTARGGPPVAGSLGHDTVVACRDGAVQIPVGGLLTLGSCDGTVDVDGPALVQLGVASTVFRGVGPGTSALVVRGQSCTSTADTSSCGPGAVLATVRVTIVASTAPPGRSDVVEAPCRAGTVVLAVGERLSLLGCPGAAQTTYAGPVAGGLATGVGAGSVTLDYGECGLLPVSFQQCAGPVAVTVLHIEVVAAGSAAGHLDDAGCGALTVPEGYTVSLDACGTPLSVAGTALSAVDATAASFTARAPGAAVVAGPAGTAIVSVR